MQLFSQDPTSLSYLESFEGADVRVYRSGTIVFVDVVRPGHDPEPSVDPKIGRARQTRG